MSLPKASLFKLHQNEWLAYYDRFPYFSSAVIRPGCYPIIREKAEHEKAVVLVHGLTDSPFYMSAIADYFFTELQHNVYLPLLQGHGLLMPDGMEGVSLQAWKQNVKFAIDTAAASAGQVSVGGLSTGGALGCHMAATEPEVTGALYLFSAALDLAGRARTGDIKEYLLRTPIADWLDGNGSLIGDNPYRYARIDKDGARELSRLIKEIDALIKGYGLQNRFPEPTFAAHSESDTTADIKGIEALQAVSDPEKFSLFRIPSWLNVAHASVVLRAPVEASAKQAKAAPDRVAVLEKANPVFDEMMQAIADFEFAMASRYAENQVSGDL